MRGEVNDLNKLSSLFYKSNLVLEPNNYDREKVEKVVFCSLTPDSTITTLVRYKVPVNKTETNEGLYALIPNCVLERN